MIVICVFVAMLAALLVVTVQWSWGARRAPACGGHPESMTEVLEPDAEEYLAWLADRHWPADEYLDLEQEWQEEFDLAGRSAEGAVPAPHLCPGCHRQSEDVWPCRMCGRLLHSSCGHGMRRRRIGRPYRTRDMRAEAVIAEWVCTSCSSVVGLDLDEEPEEH